MILGLRFQEQKEWDSLSIAYQATESTIKISASCIAVNNLLPLSWDQFDWVVCLDTKLCTDKVKRTTTTKVLRADGRLVNMSGVFCRNNAQAPSLFSSVTLTSRRSYVETVSGSSALLHIPFDWRRALLPETVSTYDRLLVSVTLEKREGACALFVQKTPNNNKKKRKKENMIMREKE